MKEVIFSSEITLEDEKVMKLDYSLTQGITETDQTTYYGVEITKYLENMVESDEILGVSLSKEDTVAMIKILYQNQVTPISMIEIVDDLITQGVA